MNRHALLSLLIAACLLGLVACDSNAEQRNDDTPTQAVEVETDRAPENEEEPAASELDEQTRQQALFDPSLVTDDAPEEFQIRFQTTQGEFTVAVDRSWAPHGADRLFNLVRIGYFEDIAFFRVIDGFMAQFGIHDDPEVNEVWRHAEIPDDEVLRSNKRGKLTFATRGPNTRTTQLFISLADNSRLDGQGFTPVGEIVDGMEVVDSLYAGYGEGAPHGEGPDQQRIQHEGNEYLRAEYENLDYITGASIVD